MFKMHLPLCVCIYIYIYIYIYILVLSNLPRVVKVNALMLIRLNGTNFISEQFTYTNLFTYLKERAAHFFWTCKMYIAYIVYYYICLPLCAHILYFDAAKFSIKLFS